MNYLSVSGGSQWDSDMLIGNFQLKVIGTAGVIYSRAEKDMDFAGSGSCG